MAFQFKVELKGVVKPSVWRRLIVPNDCTFFRFHKILQAAFGWKTTHLFLFSPGGYGGEPIITVIDEDSIKGSLPSDKMQVAHGFFIFKEGKEEIDLPCNFGTEGDILWVRENWEDYTDPELNKDFKDEARELFLSRPDKKSWPSFEFMPKAACRIFLKITSIRPDRLQNIFDEESAYKMGNYSYKDLWKRNKWVFVIDFERIDPKQYAAENKKFAKWMGNKPL